ncbi:MAG: hypothetical protein KKC79_17565 [Gammaproteobacteria bacterium]|nr:hypothetical protein [Gammaproteobacteria bacterium]
MTALPLLCIRWTSTDAGQRASMVGDAILLALPVALPLPFLLLACISALVFHPASRTRETWASFLAALAIGAAAACAVAS